MEPYGGDRYVKTFTCWNQLMALMFGQLCNREILRDVVDNQFKCWFLWNSSCFDTNLI
ncbi:MAG: DUF4372 domain-containing protein [Prevotella sp.]|nr:DUF4372 domain-containing protein [Prevotella sp.]